MDMKLETENLAIIFGFERKISPTQYYFSITIEFKDDKFPDISRRSCMLSIQDLHRLKEYFNSHISNLRELSDYFEDSYDSPVFVNLDLDFTLQALAGIIDEDGGEFSISFSIVMSDRNKYHIGIEDSFELPGVQNFLSQLDEIIDNHDDDDYEREEES